MAHSDAERGNCPERLQRCRYDFVGRRIEVLPGGTFERAIIKQYSKEKKAFSLTFRDGVRWEKLHALTYRVLDNAAWCCGWVAAASMDDHLGTDCDLRQLGCPLGCGQRLPARAMAGHTANGCPRRVVACELGCSARMRFEKIQEHLSHECRRRSVPCDDCGEYVTLEHMPQHAATTCPMAVQRCSFGCGATVPRGLMADHLRTVCPKRSTTCQACGAANLFADEVDIHGITDCPKREIGCPLNCDQRMAAETAPEHVRDACVKREITCECGARMKFEALNDHKILECPAYLRYCSLGCGLKMRAMDMAQHQEATCPKRHLCIGMLVSCPLGCGVADIPFHQQFNHVNTQCPRRVVECDLGCRNVVPAAAITDHKKTCSFRSVPCGAGSTACARQLRSWLLVDGPHLGASAEMICCEEHASTPMIFAVRNREIALLEYLIEAVQARRDQLEIESGDGHTALTKACEIGFIPAMDVLYNNGARLNHETARARTPLAEAARAGQLEALRWLIEHGAIMNHVTRLRTTAFDWAALAKQDEELKQLVRDFRVQVRPALATAACTAVAVPPLLCPFETHPQQLLLFA